MAIAVHAVGTVANGTGAISAGAPASCSYGHLWCYFIETSAQAITAAGWNEAPSSPQTEATDATRLTVFWRWREASDPATTTSDSGDHQIGRIVCFSGCAMWDNGSPFSATAGSTDPTSSTAATIPGVTTVLANQMMIYACGVTRDAASTTNFGSWANAALASADERIDNTVTDGTGGGIGVATGIKATAGAAGNMTVTLGAAGRKTYWSAALVPSVAAPPPQLVERRDYRGLVGISSRPIVGWTPSIEHAGLYLRPPLVTPVLAA